MKFYEKPLKTVDAQLIISVSHKADAMGRFNLILGNNTHQTVQPDQLVAARRPNRDDYWVTTEAGSSFVMTKADFEAKYAVLR